MKQIHKSESKPNCEIERALIEKYLVYEIRY